MYLAKLQLENIRGFKKLDFDFDRGDNQYAGWTVITGDNGSGKSTLLKSIILVLAGEHGRLFQIYEYKKWIRRGTEEYAIGKMILNIFPNIDDVDKTRKHSTDPEFISIAHKYENYSQGSSVENYPPELNLASLLDESKNGWFSCAYGPFRRVFGSATELSSKMSHPITKRYITLFEEAATLAEVDKWLIKLDHKRLENKNDSATILLEMMKNFLQDDLLPNGISFSHVDSEGLWLKDRNGVPLSWPDMSDGYRAVVSLLVDIIMHMFEAYGVENLFAQDENGKWFITRSGVVMIDEIDAHLHPEWQREIGFWMKRHFPKVQFIVTTHSPLICEAADANGIFVLPEPGSDQEPRRLTPKEQQQIVSARPDTILLSPAFGMQNTRSALAVDQRAEYAKLKAKLRGNGELTEAEKIRLKQLKEVVSLDEEL